MFPLNVVIHYMLQTYGYPHTHINIFYGASVKFCKRKSTLIAELPKIQLE